MKKILLCVVAVASLGATFLASLAFAYAESKQKTAVILPVPVVTEEIPTLPTLSYVTSSCYKGSIVITRNGGGIFQPHQENGKPFPCKERTLPE